MVRVSEHREFLESLFIAYKIPVNSLEVVPDVNEWCDRHGIKERGSPFRIAKCFCWKDGSCHIVIKDEISDEMIKSIKDTMETYGFEEEVLGLDSDFKFLLHTILHEIACKVLGTIEQALRDRWAFEEMKKGLHIKR